MSQFKLGYWCDLFLWQVISKYIYWKELLQTFHFEHSSDIDSRAEKIPEDSKARYKMISLEILTLKFSEPEVVPKFSPGLYWESCSVDWRMSVTGKGCEQRNERGPEHRLKLGPPPLWKMYLWKSSCENSLHSMHVQTYYWCSWDSEDCVP